MRCGKGWRVIAKPAIPAELKTRLRSAAGLAHASLVNERRGPGRRAGIDEKAGLTVDDKDTIRTKSRYNRIAPVYDLMEALVERFAFRRWRERLWSQVDGKRVLEEGVGTGKNAPHYSRGVRVTAVDLSDKMLERARRRVQELDIKVDLCLMDAQRLAFPDAAFDAAVVTFVFCSVPDPVRGLRELSRVVRPDGRILLLEHVRVDRPVIGRLMDLLNPIVVRVMGANINRRTVGNVRRAGLTIERVEDLAPMGLMKLIVARPDMGRLMESEK